MPGIKNIKYCNLIIILAILLTVINLNSQSVYVPLNHWVYDFIERVETKQLIHSVLNSTKPLSRAEIAYYLKQIQKKKEYLNKVEQEQLEFLAIEFLDSNYPYKTRIEKIRENKYIRKLLPRLIYENRRNFLSWEADQFKVFFDPVLNYQRKYSNIDSLHYTEKIFQLTNGARIWGNLGDRLGFFIDARDNKEWGNKKYRLGNYTLPRLGFVRATSPDFIYHDETDAYVKFGVKYIDLAFGKFKNYWGPGYSGSLILSDYATSYDQFQFEVTHRRFKFTSIYAYLIDYQDFTVDSLQQRKYLAAHRLEFAPTQWLSLGLSETVVFKNRSFEPAYFNPVMFFRSAEHYLGSPDNMMMGIDFKCLIIKNVKFYGELLIDDITTTKLGTNWFGNKLGLMSGIFFANIATIDNLDLRIEYVRIRPYVYSHIHGLTYTHYSSTLGHPIGPNADLFTLLFNYQLTMRLKLQLSYYHLRHGANSEEINYGGDLNRYYIHGDDPYPQFLGGIKEFEHTGGLFISYEILKDLYIRLNFKYCASKKSYQKVALISFGIN